MYGYVPLGIISEIILYVSDSKTYSITKQYADTTYLLQNFKN